MFSSSASLTCSWPRGLPENKQDISHRREPEVPESRAPDLQEVLPGSSFSWISNTVSSRWQTGGLSFTSSTSITRVPVPVAGASAGGQMAERLGSWAISQKTLCPYARHFTLLASRGMSLYLL